MRFPERVNNRGNTVPAFEVDDEFADEVAKHKWTLMRSGTGYLVARIAGKFVYLHRFVWQLRHGDCPKELDHISRDTLDNRLSNLRAADRTLQLLNRRVASKAGLPPGVSLRKDRPRPRPYQARLMVGGALVFRGDYATPEEASAAYETARSAAIEQASQAVA